MKDYPRERLLISTLNVSGTGEAILHVSDGARCLRAAAGGGRSSAAGSAAAGSAPARPALPAAAVRCLSVRWP
jgi:hypothetical protein